MAANTNAPPETFKQVDFDTAEALLTELLPHTGQHLWKNAGQERGWLFRGQLNASWGLQPAAMREGNRHKYVAGQVNIPATTVTERLKLEHQMMIDFSSLADSHGFHIPHDSAEFRTRIPTYNPCEFPPKCQRAAYALAQHYGVPTRMLDWTPRPLVGAYFACDQAAEFQIQHYRPRRLLPSPKPERCAVWALSQAAVWAQLGSTDPRISFVTAPAANIPNLRAQGGLFTLVEHVHDGQCQIDDPPNLDDLVKQHTTLDSNLWKWAPYLYKFTFPLTESSRLLFLLSQLDVTAASIYPGLSSIELAMYERNMHKQS